MTVNIMESDGSLNSSIPLLDIDHIETRTLSFFGQESHNFYLFMKKEQGGYFMLLTYTCPLHMEQAKQQLQSILKRQKNETVVSEKQVFNLFPFALPGETKEHTEFLQ